MKFFLLNILLFLAATITLADVIYQSNFSSSVDGFKKYGKNEPTFADNALQLTTGTTRAMPWKGAGTYSAIAKLSGNGDVQMSIYGSMGQAFSQTLNLSGEKTLTFDYFEPARGFQLYIYPVGAPHNFKLLSLTLEAAALPDMPNEDVEAQALEAEDFPGPNGSDLKDENASGKKARTGERWYVPVDLPVPLTRKPLYLYIRCRKAVESKLSLSIKKGTQNFKAVQIPSLNYEYIKLGPFDARAGYPKVQISIDGTANAKAIIDRLVWSTNAALTDEALNGALSMQLNAPGVAAIPTQEIPRIDGDLKEKAWSQGLPITPFLVNLSDEKAADQTESRLLYDSKNLYVAFKANASVLDVTLQKLHEFRNQLTKPDINHCYDDDVVLLLLHNIKTGKLYEFAVNGNGVLTSATSTAPDYWENRTAFSTEAQSAGKVENGYFSVELAIPLAELGLSQVANDEVEILLGRVEKSRKESSSFNKVVRGFHTPDSWMKLFFAKRPVKANLLALPEFQAGPNQISYVSDDKLLYCNTIVLGNLTKKFINPDGKFDISNNGEFKYSSAVLNAVNLEPLLIAPLTRCFTVSNKLEFTPPSGVSVTRNDANIANGGILYSGKNILKISGANALGMEFKIGEHILKVDENWLTTPDGKLEQTVMIDSSIIWPDWKKSYLGITAGGLQQILFEPNPPVGKTLEDYTFYVDLPAGFTFEGASGYYKKYQLETEAQGTVRIGNTDYNRFAIKFKNLLKYADKVPEHQYVLFVIKAPEKPTEKTYTFFFHAGSKKDGITELPQACKIKIFPKIDGRNQNFQRIQMWEHWMHAIDDEALADKLIAQLKQSGVNEFLYTTSNRDREIKLFKMIDFTSGNFPMSQFVKMNGDAALKGFDGKMKNNMICPAVFKKDPAFKVWFDTEFKRWYQRNKEPEIICWDYEYNVFNGMVNCFDERCLKEFAAVVGLDSIPSPQVIREKYRKEWINFSTTQTAELAKIIQDARNRLAPGAEFYIYSGYQSEQTKEIYGVDWDKLAPYFDYAGAGYGRPAGQIEATIQACAGKTFIVGVISNVYFSTQRQNPTPPQAAQLMRAMLDSNGGILIYHYSGLDGRTMNALGEISRLVDEYPGFFQKDAVKVKPAGFKVEGAGYELIQDANGNLLLIVINSSDSTKSITITVPDSVEKIAPFELAGQGIFYKEFKK